jgi:hypothetical protein
VLRTAKQEMSSRMAAQGRRSLAASAADWSTPSVLRTPQRLTTSFPAGLDSVWSRRVEQASEGRIRANLAGEE